MTFSGPWTRAIGRVSNGLSNWPLDDSDRVLDVGCGTGSATILAAAMAKEVVGIDLSPDMIELAEEKVQKECLKNTRLMATSVEDYCPDNPFDKVISSFMIPHVKPGLRPAIYSCMYNFLKPGGVVGLFGSRREVCDVYKTHEEIEENLTRSGFEDIVLYDVHDIYRIAVARRPRPRRHKEFRDRAPTRNWNPFAVESARGFTRSTRLNLDSGSS